MSTAALRKSVRHYYETRRLYAARAIENESSVRQAFLALLSETARPHRWLVVTEHSTKAYGGRLITPDATLQDEYSIPRGYYEAKDIYDDLDREIRHKLSIGSGRRPRRYDASLSILDSISWELLRRSTCLELNA